jgi:hypothetical protein
MTESDLIARAAHRARCRGPYVASVLVQYQQEHAISKEDLAKQLDCPIAALDKLALCRKPQTDAALEKISHYTEIAIQKLGEVLPLSSVQ